VSLRIRAAATARARLRRAVVETWLRLAARVRAWRFAKPASRIVLVAAGLACMAAIGRGAVAGSAGAPAAPAPVGAPVPPNVPPPAHPAGSSPAPVLPAPVSGTPPPESSTPARVRASPDDPVVLNSAGVDDLRRLPGIGEKRANAILALRARLGRLRAVEDLLKVRGIGRAMLKRLRPLVRLDAKSVPDAGASEAEH